MRLRAQARVNLAAIERNCARLRSVAGSGTALCAVVKANAYGHGTVPAAQAALAGGATWLAVAAAEEAVELRAARVEAPILMMGAMSADELPAALEAGADVVAWRPGFVEALRSWARSSGRTVRVHVKLDVGMGRLGIRDADELLALAERVEAAPELELVGAMTHLPCADEDLPRTRAEVERFRAFGERLRTVRSEVILHAANSAATLVLPEARLDMMRCGVAVYGLDPFGVDAAAHGLEPAMEMRSYVGALKELGAGESVGYGGTFVARERTWIATLPIGYGDGWRRAFSDNAEVLIGGRRCPLVGRVSMDNVTVDVGDEAGGIAEGDEAILLGRSGDEWVTAEELARRIDTINYEITTGLTARPTRVYHRDGDDASS